MGSFISVISSHTRFVNRRQLQITGELMKILGNKHLPKQMWSAVPSTERKFMMQPVLTAYTESLPSFSSPPQKPLHLVPCQAATSQLHESLLPMLLPCKQVRGLQ